MVRIVVDEEFVEVRWVVFEEGWFVEEIVELVVEMEVYVGWWLNLDGVVDDGVFGVEWFGEVGKRG